MTDHIRRRPLRRPIAHSVLTGLRLHHRALTAVAFAIAVYLLLPGTVGLSVRLATAWNSGGLAYLAMAAFLMSTCSTVRIRRLASQEDETRFVFFCLILFALVSSFYAMFALMVDAKTQVGAAKVQHICLAALTILVSWLAMQVVFTLHYAHAFYGDRNDDTDIDRGMIFPHDDAPDYWDFFYFTTSIGATSQTSDVAITSKSVRRMVAFQSILAFVFNTAIVALAINLASGLV